MGEVPQPILKLWSRDQKATSVRLLWEIIMRLVVDQLSLLEEAIQHIRIPGDTNLHCRCLDPIAWFDRPDKKWIETQLAPVVSPRHFTPAPVPPATEQFGHCPKVIIESEMTIDMFSKSFSGQRRPRPLLQLLLEHYGWKWQDSKVCSKVFFCYIS